MRYQPTQAEIESYRENGFVVIENFLDAGELEHWRTVTEAAVADRLASSTGKPWHETLNNQADPDNYYAQVFTQCVKLADSWEPMRELMFDPRLGELAGT